ncbi:hypothetical protein THI4931_17870 [Pandoraea sputorum]|nr:hypothetical protein THI4931_17870 [Pandoraea sputorum]
MFGSVNRDCPGASDIDLMIFCESDAQADMLRLAITSDSFSLPLHLSLLTFEEAAAINASSAQQSTLILRVDSATAAKPSPPPKCMNHSPPSRVASLYGK